MYSRNEVVTGNVFTPESSEVLDHLPLLICKFLPDTTLTYINETGCKTFGKTKQELYAVQWIRFVPEEAALKVSDVLRSVRNSLQAETHSYWIKNVCGERMFVQWRIYPIVDKENQFQGYLGIGSDKTKESHAEAEIRSKNNLIENMLNTIDDVIWSADAKTYTTLYMSQAAKKIYGLDADAFYKDKELWRNMIHPEDKHIADQKLRELEDGGKYSEVQYRIVRPDRETRNINDRCWVVEDEFGNPDRIEGIARDITIQKDREKRAANETKSKNRLISAAAHDLKNPISGIISLVDFLKDQVEGENNLELLNMMSKAGHKALHIIQDLLQIAELENENYRLKPEKSDLNFLVSTVIDHNKTEAAQKGIRLYANLLKDKIPVRIELLKFQRVLENLVSNSLKFTKEGGTIVLRTFVDGEKAVIEVEDDGIGIPAALQSSVFDQFTRAKRQGLNGEQATGLGMSIAKVIVELHKGKIGIQSEEGLGTKCIIEIPMDVQNETKTE